MHNLQAKLSQIDRRVGLTQNEKQALTADLQRNKEVLDRLKNNSALLELDKREEDL